MEIQNDLQLNEILANDLKIVINNVTDRLIDELKNIIQNVVYDSHEPTFYVREQEGNLKNSWTHDMPEVHGDTVTSLIYQDYNSLRVDLNNWVHGSIYSGELDENGLNEIINTGKIGDMANFPQLGARPFWDEFQEFVETHLDEIFLQECSKVGLRLSSNNAIFQFN